VEVARKPALEGAALAANVVGIEELPCSRHLPRPDGVELFDAVEHRYIATIFIRSCRRSPGRRRLERRRRLHGKCDDFLASVEVSVQSLQERERRERRPHPLQGAS
jgi:hypothetical protein